VTKRHRPGEDQGSAAVEFVLVLPVLLIILFAIIDFGRLLNAKIVLSQAAHEGARAAALVDAAEAQGVISRIIGTMSAGLSEPVIEACDSVPAPGSDATVTLTYQFEYVTPLAVFGGFGSESGSTLTATAVAPCL
jgi:Flp pilus assembly protein TadG